jgi:hypothetical protein
MYYVMPGTCYIDYSTGWEEFYALPAFFFAAINFGDEG